MKNHLITSSVQKSLAEALGCTAVVTREVEAEARSGASGYSFVEAEVGKFYRFRIS